MKFTTKVLNTKYPKADNYNALRFPTYTNAAFEFSKSEDLEAAFKGTKPEHIYSRSSNPTVQYFEQTMCNVTGALHCIAVASGLSAITYVLLALAKSGDEIIASNKLFGNTYSLLASTFNDFGIKVNFVDINNKSEIESKISNKTRAIFCETITNPQIEVIDLSLINDIAKKHTIPFVVDSTATPPNIFNAKAFGVDIEVLSGTKFISGGGTGIGGIILEYGTFKYGHFDRYTLDYQKFGPFTLVNKLRKELYRNLGACMSPQTASYLQLGLETIELRTEKACYNAQKVADFLEKSDKILQVNYPGLQSSSYYDLAKEQFSEFGSIISFECASKNECYILMDALKIIRRATNLQDNKSLIIHPESTIYCEYSNETKQLLDVNDRLIRLSVGIENIEDLIIDLEQAIQKI